MLTIKHFLDKETATFTYVVSDPSTAMAAIIDPVLNYDPTSGKTTTTSADEVIAYVRSNGLTLQWILETHIHADHLTSSSYIKSILGGRVALGGKIIEVLKYWVPLFNTGSDTPLDGSQFDFLFHDNQIFQLGSIDVQVLYTPGHTPACVSYKIEDAIFVGDTIFMPDVGTARTDFPGGSAETLYDSIHRILALPETTRIYTCHDYPPEGRAVSGVSTVQEQKENNVLIRKDISKDTYVQVRNQRDHGKAVPKLLLPSLQVNLRVGSCGQPENNGIQYIKIPVNQL